MSVCMISIYRKLELTAINKLWTWKVWFHSTFLVKFHGYFVRNFKSLKQLFLNLFWIKAFNIGACIYNFKYHILTLQNQKVADKE